MGVNVSETPVNLLHASKDLVSLPLPTRIMEAAGSTEVRPPAVVGTAEPTEHDIHALNEKVFFSLGRIVSG